MNEMDITPEQKKEWIVQALGIKGYVENEHYPGMFSRDVESIRTVVDLTAGRSSYLYDIIKKCRINGDNESGTLAKLDHVLDEAETGAMPAKSEPDYVVGANAVSNEHVGINTGLSEPVAQTDNIPSEIIHNPAAPVPPAFQPQGMMIMDIQPGLAEIGAIKIGGKGEERKSKQSGQPYRLPVKYDHFMILTKQKDDKGDYIVDPIMKEWGFSGTVDEGPVELDIYLLYNDPTANFLTSYRQYKGGKCLCSGNGIEAVKADGTKIQCNPKTCPISISKQCKPNPVSVHLGLAVQVRK